MLNRPVFSLRLVFAAVLVTVFGASQIAAQTPHGSTSARAVLGARIDESQTVALRGNVRADLTPQRDAGPAEDERPMSLSLLLARSPEQQSDLDALIAQQQQPGSPAYHQWLTPAQFGERFGAAQADVAKLTAWLESHGFTVTGLLNNGSILQFSATAGQVRNAFKTQIHYWNVQGGRYAANAQDPAIPTDVSSLVVGIEGLNQIPKVPHHTAMGQAAFDSNTHKWSEVTANANVPVTPKFNAGGGNYFVTPQDFYTIYHVNPVFTGGNLGAGATIAVVEQSDMQYGTVTGSGVASGGDVATFRTLFGIGGTLNMKVMHGAGTVSCSAPGIVNGDEGEATLDAEWANALAPSAQLIYMACSPFVNNGVISSLMALIDNNIGNVLSMSYGSSEINATSSDFAFNDSLFQQAATQGQTVIVSAGDSGSDTQDQNTSGTATSGLNVDQFAASPLVLGAGGTDFSDLYDNLEGGVAQTTYWSNTNTSHFGDALSYIPETPWNNSCASSIITKFEGFTGAGFCGVGTSTGFVLGDVVAGGGGFSTHYSQPSYQTGTLGMTGTKRAVPDISFFAANGVWGHALVFCDSSSSSSNCSSSSTFGLAGGTSFVAPQLAGVTGLLVTATGASQGTLNSKLYSMAQTQFTGSLASSCYSNGQTGNTSVTTSLPNSACIFHDVTTSNNDVPCAKNSASCFVNSGASYGMLSTTGSGSLTTGYPSTVGYDEATGLGSVDVFNLIQNWGGSSGGGSLGVSPNSLAFGSQADLKPSNTKPVTVTNTGTTSVTISGYTFTGANPADFSQTNNCPGTLTMGSSCTVTVTFTPQATGSRAATLNVASSATGSPATVSLTGTGVGNPVNPVITPAAGTYVTSTQVSLSDATPGALIYYLINGGTPVKYTVPFTVSASETVAAIGVVIAGNTFTTSTLVNAKYVIDPPPVNPTFTPTPGTYSGTTLVTINESSAGATVYYSVNGGAWTKYTTAISLAPGTTYTVKALGYTPNGTSFVISSIVTGVYTIH